MTQKKSQNPRNVKEYLLAVKVENVLEDFYKEPVGEFVPAHGGKTTAGGGRFRILTMVTSHGTYKAWVEGKGCEEVKAEWQRKENWRGPKAAEILAALKLAAGIKE